MSTYVLPRTVGSTGPEPGRWESNSGRTGRGTAVKKDDMILISVDDHIIEPPDMFRDHLPSQVQG